MRTAVKLLTGLLVLSAVLAGIEMSHPRGVAGLFGDLTGKKKRTSTSPDVRLGTAAPAPAAQPAAQPAQRWGPGAAKQLSWGDRDYDRGDFDGAVANYGASRVLAGDDDERRRATTGLERALLAAALVRGAAAVKGSPSELSAEAAKRISAAEAAPSEKLWLETARWLAGAGEKDRLSYAVGQALDLARPGGFVQAALEDALPTAEHRRDDLAGAMASRGLREGTPLASMPVPGPHVMATKRTPAASPPGESSGIGGVNERGIPFGKFSTATREKLRKAIQLEKQGTIAYRAATPDSPNRLENRRTALDCLKQARDAYQAALEEDSDCPDLDERLKDVMLMIAQLKKDEGIGQLK